MTTMQKKIAAWMAANLAYGMLILATLIFNGSIGVAALIWTAFLIPVNLAGAIGTNHSTIPAMWRQHMVETSRAYYALLVLLCFACQHAPLAIGIALLALTEEVFNKKLCQAQ